MLTSALTPRFEEDSKTLSKQGKAPAHRGEPFTATISGGRSLGKKAIESGMRETLSTFHTCKYGNSTARGRGGVPMRQHHLVPCDELNKRIQKYAGDTNKQGKPRARTGGDYSAKIQKIARDPKIFPAQRTGASKKWDRRLGL